MKHVLLVAGLTGIAAAVALATFVMTRDTVPASRDAGTAPAAARLLEIFAAKTGPADSIANLHRVPTDLDIRELRYLGELGSRRYYAALSGDGRICLIADGITTSSGGCGSQARFATSGQSLVRGTARSVTFSAILLPDGYSNAASALPWATLLGRNLLIVTDIAAAPNEVRISLPADEPTADPLEIAILG